jgi:cobalt-zinc-cadmium resistance protein CzcA
MFRPMALTVMLALGGALALAMTLMPVLASFFLGGSVSETENALMRGLQRGAIPERSFGWIRRPGWVAAGAVLLFGASVALFLRLGA